MDDIAIGIKFISRIIPLIPILLFVYLENYKHRVINLIMLLVSVSFLTDTTIFLLSLIKKPSALVSNIYFILQFALVSCIYFQLYIKKVKKLKFLIGFGAAFILINWVFWQEIDDYQNFMWAGTAIIISAIVFGHFSYLIQFPVIRIKQYAPYWISTGLLFYCCLSFLLLGLGKALASQLAAEDFRVVWMFHNLNNIFKNGCFTMAIWWAARRNPEWDIAEVHEN